MHRATKLVTKSHSKRTGGPRRKTVVVEEIVRMKGKSSSRKKPRTGGGPVRKIPGTKGLASFTADRAFMACLRDPFDRLARGCRIPSPYCTPTATGVVQGTMTVSANPAGIFNMVWFPSPLVSLITAGYLGEGYASSSMNPLVVTGGVPQVWGAAAPTNLAALFSGYRVVGWGLRIRNFQPPSTCTGRIFAAQYPVVGPLPSYQQVLALGAPVYNTVIASVMATGTPAPSMLEAETSAECSAQDLITRDMLIVARPNGPGCLNFRPGFSSGGYNSAAVEVGGDWATIAGGVLTVLPGSVASTPDRFEDDFRGWSAIYLYGEGFIPSTVSLDLEYVYHLEGYPITTSVATGAVTPDFPLMSPGRKALGDIIAATAAPLISLSESLATSALGSQGGKATRFLLETLMAKTGFSF